MLPCWVSHQKVTSKTTTGRIHGTGRFTYMNGWFFMVNVGKYTVPYMDPMGNWVVATQRFFIFNPIWGRFLFWRIFFQMGGKKPPTRKTTTVGRIQKAFVSLFFFQVSFFGKYTKTLSMAKNAKGVAKSKSWGIGLLGNPFKITPWRIHGNGISTYLDPFQRVPNGS